MLKRFYFEDTYMSNNKVEKKIADILLKFGSMHLTDLDSLDLVKFFIEIEDTFNIKIKDDRCSHDFLNKKILFTFQFIFLHAWWENSGDGEICLLVYSFFFSSPATWK